MESLKEVVLDYLKEKNTDYAIVVSGEWGCGKTYYIRNTLFSTVKGIDVPKIDKPKGALGKATVLWMHTKTWFRKHFRQGEKNTVVSLKYEPIHLSLYGITSTDDIFKRIMSELFPGLNSIISVLGTGVQAVSDNTKIKLPIPKVELKKIETFSGIPQDKVFFFDDLERIDNSLDVQSVLGVINQYVEKYNCKVIIICNEEHVSEKYKTFKEKTVRYTIRYTPDISSIYDILCNEEDTKSKEGYANFLRKKKSDMLQIFKVAKSQNLRTLKFIIQSFRKVYDSIALRKKYCANILHDFLLFYTICSIEYKDGINPNHLYALEVIALNNMDSYIAKLKSDQKNAIPQYDIPSDDVIQRLYSQYALYRSSFGYYEVIKDYIVHGFIDNKQLANLVEKKYNEYNRRETTDAGKLMWQLKHREELTKSIAEVEKSLLTYIRQDRYNIAELVSIYGELVAFQFANIEKYVISDAVTDEFKSSIDRLQKTHVYSPIFARFLLQWDSNDTSGAKEKFEKIANYALQANENKKMKDYLAKGEELLQKLKDADDAYITSFVDNVEYNKRVLCNLPFEKVVAFLKESSYKSCKLFYELIVSLYPTLIASNIDHPENDFLRKLYSELKTLLSSDDIPLRHEYLLFLYKFLSKHGLE